MDETIGKQILEEMKKQTRINQLSIIVLALVIGVGTIQIRSMNKKHSEQTSPSWSQVRSALDQNDYPKALQVAQTLIGSRTDDYYGEEYLGIIYHEAGNLDKAELHYARAYELFPSEEYEKKLVALRKALEFKNRQ